MAGSVSLRTVRAQVHRYADDPAVLSLTDPRRTEKRPCVCRGWVSADPADPTSGVRLHNGSAQHQAWRESRGQGYSPAPPPDVTVDA